MKYAKKEKFYVNSLKTSEPTTELAYKKTSIDLRSYEELKKEMFKQRIIYFRGNTTKAAKSLKINRNTLVSVVGLNTVQQVREELLSAKKEDFTRAFGAFRGNMELLAKNLGISESRVTQLATEYGLRLPMVRKKRKLGPKQLELFRG